MSKISKENLTNLTDRVKEKSTSQRCLSVVYKRQLGECGTREGKEGLVGGRKRSVITLVLMSLNLRYIVDN